MSAGLPNEAWTLPRLARLVRERFGVDHHPSHLSRVLAAMGFSCQRPTRRAIERDGEKIRHWKRHKWPALKKARRDGRVIVCIDETGISIRSRRGGLKEHLPLFEYVQELDRGAAVGFPEDELIVPTHDQMRMKWEVMKPKLISTGEEISLKMGRNLLYKARNERRSPSDGGATRQFSDHSGAIRARGPCDPQEGKGLGGSPVASSVAFYPRGFPYHCVDPFPQIEV